MLTVDDLLEIAITIRDSDFDYTEEVTLRLRTHTSPFEACTLLRCSSFNSSQEHLHGIQALRSLKTGNICDIYFMNHGYIHGPRITFCPITSSLFEIRPYIQGRAHGIILRYDIEGTVIGESLYINGDSMTERLRQIGITRFSEMSDVQRSHIKLALGIDL